MTQKKQIHITILSVYLTCTIALLSILSLFKSANNNNNTSYTEVLTDTISKITSSHPGEIGVAVIINNSDTICINNRSIYPMMSVFKVHQALAICNEFDNKGLSLDSLINIKRNELNPNTWSPMMNDYTDSEFSLTIKELLHYALTQSGNNASNIIFNKFADTSKTDSIVATLIPRSSFKITYTENEMSANHNKAYSNYTSPLGAAILMNLLFTDSLVSYEKQQFIMNALHKCITGKDRISAPLLDKENAYIAHKTGSGFINERGELVAHNDVGYICLSNNNCYTLAVFIKDFKGDTTQASEIISQISSAVYSILTQLPPPQKPSDYNYQSINT